MRPDNVSSTHLVLDSTTKGSLTSLAADQDGANVKFVTNENGSQMQKDKGKEGFGTKFNGSFSEVVTVYRSCNFSLNNRVRER